jgi:hypothetical protein
VIRVKILFNKKDSALVQMAENHQAHLGKQIIVILFLTGWKYLKFLSKTCRGITINDYGVYKKCSKLVQIIVSLNNI